MSSAEHSKKLRTVIKGKFTRMNNTILKNIDEDSSRTLIENRLKELRKTWEDVQRKHEEYILLDEVEMAQEENWIVDVSKTFDDTEAMVDAYLNKSLERDNTEAEAKRQLEIQETLEKGKQEKENDLRKKLKAVEVQAVNKNAKFDEALASLDNLMKSNEEGRYIAKSIPEAVKRLETCKNEVETVQNEYSKLCIEDGKDAPETVYDTILQAEKRFLEISNSTKLFCSKHELLEGKQQEAASTGRGVRLEKIKFHMFNGDIRNYPCFREDFKKHIKPNYTDGEEAFVLRSYLDSEIREDVLALGDNASAIWERLDHKYGDEGKLVDSIMAEVKHMKRCNDDNPKGIVEMITIIERSYRDLSRLAMEQEMSNSTIVSLIEEKLPRSIEDDWLDMVTGEKRLTIGRDKFPQLLRLLNKHKEKLEYKYSELRYVESKAAELNIADDRTVKRSVCWIHTDGFHPIWKCKAFEKKTPEEKIELIRKHKACSKCLEVGHTGKECSKEFQCRKAGCGQPHHSLIHEAYEQGITLHGEQLPDNTCRGDTLLLLQQIKAKHNSQRLEASAINCLWDSGSTLSFITFRMAKKLKLKGRKIHLNVTKIGGVTEEQLSSRYDLSLIDENGKMVTVNVVGLERISTNIRTVKIDQAEAQLTTEKLRRPTEGEVDCLLGMDVAGFHPTRIKAVGHLILLKNEFGLVIGGYHPKIEERTVKVVQQAFAHLTHVQFQDLENIGTECKPKCGSCSCGRCHPGGLNMTLEEEREYKQIEEGLIFNESTSRWIARYPCKKDLSELVDNKAAALGALYSLERRLEKNNEHAQLYKSQMDDMLNRKACRLLSNEEVKTYTGPKYYIAHHEVIKKESKSTPCRIVFNSSAKFKGQSLNDCYVKGPSMLSDLLGLLLRFCQEEVAIVGDISKMYHSIEITYIDQMTHRFLWRCLDKTRKPEVFVMNVVNFGDRPSGSIAMAALRKTAKMSMREFPEASKAIQDNSYMDDILVSVGDEQKAKMMRETCTEVLKRGGFHVKDWVTSGENKENSELRLLTSKDSHNNEERVLGMLWNPVADKFHFKAKLNFSTKKRGIHLLPDLKIEDVSDHIPEKLTKRMILSQINGIFDPRGLITPSTIRAKILMRKLWTQEIKLDWDDPIPKDLHVEAKAFFTEMFEIEKLSFPRCLKPEGAIGDPMLVLFSDGSKDAFAAAAYVRWNTGSSQYKSNLIGSKTRIAPIKTVSIVRLELCGAVLSKRLRVFIESEMNYKFTHVAHIVDSEIVESMIRKQSHGFNTYAANRIGEIQGSTNPDEWFWLPGELNIADYSTRGMHPNNLDENSLWQRGPKFLELPMEKWPVKQNMIEHLPEQTVSHVAHEMCDSLANRFDLNRFSKLSILINTTVKIFKLYERYNTSNSVTNSNEVTAEDIHKVEIFWAKEAQSELKEPMEKGKLARLTPRYRDNLIVVGGRTSRFVTATWNHQEFILLPYSHRFSYLVACDMHKKSGHLGVSSTTAMIRSKYWIINLPRLAKKICFSCVFCKVKRMCLHGQIMSSLPVERLQPSPPFYFVGVDYFGPYDIKGEVNKRCRGKCYGVIFTCFTTRAIHLELSVDYSTDAFIQTLRRFVCIRGWPRQFTSDNGTQLTAASKELSDVIVGLDHKKIGKNALVGGSEWKYCPANAPWMNGATESLVKSVKGALHATIGSQVLAFSEFQTVMYEAAQIVNQRPIGRNPTGPDDGTYLCPNDLLLGRATPHVPQGPFKERSSMKYRLDFIERLTEQFWIKWSRDLFPSLVIQQKWHVEKRDVKINDVVMIQDANMLRGKFRMGIITNTFPSKDGRIRRVSVSYKNNKEGSAYTGTKYTTVERAVHKLIVIVPSDEIQDEEVTDN